MMLAFGQTAGNKGKTQLQNSRFGLSECAQENNNLGSSRTKDAGDLQSGPCGYPQLAAFLRSGGTLEVGEEFFPRSARKTAQGQ
jgi:hypothetical protein